MGLLDFLFKNFDVEYKRDVPEDIRQSMHRLLDRVLDTQDDIDSNCLGIELHRKLDSARELYPIRNIGRNDHDQ